MAPDVSSLPRRGMTTQPRASAASPWVRMPPTHPTLRGLHKKSRYFGSLCPTLSGLNLLSVAIPGLPNLATLGFDVKPPSGLRPAPGRINHDRIRQRDRADQLGRSGS